MSKPEYEIGRVVVCGGRGASNEAAVFAALDVLHAELGFSGVIEGASPGIDEFAGRWAQARGLEHLQFPADWQGLGKRAGPVRNQQMLDLGRPTMVIAFPGGPGTADMAQRARRAGLAVRRVRGTF
jgi:predicted Rossmann-fold nucleotide-binding protein